MYSNLQAFLRFYQYVFQNLETLSFFSYMINNWNGVDTEKATQYVLDSLSYEGKLLRYHEELRNNRHVYTVHIEPLFGTFHRRGST
jgi:hypothetical protein